MKLKERWEANCGIPRAAHYVVISDKSFVAVESDPNRFYAFEHRGFARVCRLVDGSWSASIYLTPRANQSNFLKSYNTKSRDRAFQWAARSLKAAAAGGVL